MLRERLTRQFGDEAMRVVFRRVPGTYIGCASGLVTNQNHPRTYACRHCVGIMTDLDGVLFNDSNVSLTAVSDGTSNTMLVGEALPVPATLNPAQKEPVRTKDHWYIGGDDPDINIDLSEFFGSSGVPMNTDNELSFGSSHPGGCHVMAVDGSVHFVSERVDLEMWSRLG